MDKVPGNVEEEQDDEDTIKLISFVDNFISNLFLNSFDSGIGGTKSCHTVLCYGLNSRRLRTLQFLFGQQITRRTSCDVHLVRSGYLPNLVDRNFLIKHLCGSDGLIKDLADGHFLELLKIVYLYQHRNLVDHLLQISTENLRQSLPAALIVDDIGHYLKSEQSDSDQSAKRTRYEANPSLQLLIQLCSLLVETIDYCASKTGQLSFLVVCVDQNNLASSTSTTTSKDLLFQIGKRFFNHKINVDQL